MSKAVEERIFTWISITMFATLQTIGEENEDVAAKTTCPYSLPSFLQTLEGVIHQRGPDLPTAASLTRLQAQLLKVQWLPRWFSSNSTSQQQVLYLFAPYSK